MDTFDCDSNDSEVPRVKCGSSHSLQSERSDAECEGEKGVDIELRCDDVGGVVGGVSSRLESRDCLPESGFDVSGEAASVEVGDVGRVFVDQECRVDVSGVVGDVSRADSLGSARTFIGPLSEKDQAEVSDLQLMTPGIDEGDARRLLQERHSVRGRKGRSASTPKRSAADRKALIAKYKALRGWSTPPRSARDFSKREKQLIARVKEFNDKEADNAKVVMKQADEYCQGMIQRISLVPFTAPTQRTAEMTGVNERNIRSYAKQAREVALTPKKKSGRKYFDPPDWVFADIRILVTG